MTDTPATPILPPAEQPRERKRRHGVQALSVAELLALLIGSEGKAPDTLATATEAMTKAGGSLRRLSRLSDSTLAAIAGLTTANADAIHAALELGRRLIGEAYEVKPEFRAPRDVGVYFASRLEDLGVEEFHIAILDAQHRMERDVLVTRGILNSSLVHPREVFREAIAERAAAIILVHNHPSGDPTPSADDRAVTAQLVQAGRVLDIPVHDHVIIGKGRYVSFAESGLL